jgi:hypothetical protein
MTPWYLALGSSFKSMKHRWNSLLFWFAYLLDSRVTPLFIFYGTPLSIVAASSLWLLVILLWTLAKGNSALGLSLVNFLDYQIELGICNLRVPGPYVQLYQAESWAFPSGNRGIGHTSGGIRLAQSTRGWS